MSLLDAPLSCRDLPDWAIESPNPALPSGVPSPEMYAPVVKSGKLYIPDWCLEDTPAPNPEISYERYRALRRQSYYACRWYPHLVQENIPTLDSQLVDFDDLQEAMARFPEHRFVRTCGSSPKDVTVPIFQNATEAYRALTTSKRTSETLNQGHRHLLLREVVKILIECRCFVHQRQLRAVSIYCYLEPAELATFQEQIIEFFDLYGPKLPYNSAVVEVCMAEGYDFPLIVEFNSFGIDQFAGASLFDWDRDKEILYHSSEPVFRMPGEFDWT